MHDLVIYGAGGLGREIAEVVRRINEQHYVWNFLGFVDDALSPPAPVWEGREVLGNMDFIRTFRGPLDVDISATGDYSRRWHLPVFALAGFDRAIRFPWRQAVGLCHSLGIEWQPPVASAEINLVLSQLESRLGVVFTSSLGRLFDAAASILGLCHEVTFEAQAAMLLEQAAATANPHRDRPTSLSEIVHKLFNPSYSVAQRARDFHNDIAALLVSHLPPAVEKFGISGGCALNRLLIDDLRFHLNHPLLQHAVVPANDGGLSLGQAVAGRLQLGSLNLADPR